MESIQQLYQLKNRVLAEISSLLEAIEQYRLLSVADNQNNELLMQPFIYKLKDKIESNVFKVMVVGEFSTGKSTLINALLRANILPTHVRPTTSNICLIRYAKIPKVTIYYRDGLSQEVPLNRLNEYSALFEQGNQLAEQISEINICYPLDYCKDGIEILDTPGLNSLNQAHEQVTLEYLPNGNAAIMVLSATQFLSASEREYLRIFRRYMNKVLFVVTKVDHLPHHDSFEHNREYWEQQIYDIIGQRVKLYPVNAKIAADGDWKSSGMASFVQDFEQFLVSNDKVKEMFCPPIHTLLEIIDVFCNNIDFKLKAFKCNSNEFDAIIEIQRKKVDTIRNTICTIQKILAEKEDEYINEFEKQLTQIFNIRVVSIMQFIYRYDGDIKTIGKAILPFVKEQLADAIYIMQHTTDRFITTIQSDISQELLNIDETAELQNIAEFNSNLTEQIMDTNKYNYNLKKELLSLDNPWRSVLNNVTTLFSSPFDLFNNICSFFNRKDRQQQNEQRQRQLANIAAQVSKMIAQENSKFVADSMISFKQIISDYRMNISNYLLSASSLLENVIAETTAEKNRQSEEINRRLQQYQKILFQTERVKASLLEYLDQFSREV